MLVPYGLPAHHSHHLPPWPRHQAPTASLQAQRPPDPVTPSWIWNDELQV